MSRIGHNIMKDHVTGTVLQWDTRHHRRRTARLLCLRKHSAAEMNSILTLRVKPYFDNIRSHARYAELAHRIGLPQRPKTVLRRLSRLLERRRCRHPILKQEKAEHAAFQ